MVNFRPSSITRALVAAGLSCSMALAAPDEVEKAEEAIQPQDQSAVDNGVVATVVATTDIDTEDRGEVLVITGFKGSLFRSLEKKRNSDIVSEHLSADDLGALPDVSIADAITRLPGIAAVRTGGSASEINIRGMSGGFVFTTLNGREQVSTTGSRSVEFSQYPTELISSAAVYKSQKASLIEGGIAGSVELTTASPLDNDQQHSFNANVRGMFNDRADEVYGADDTGHRFSFSYQGKFLEDTLGVSVGYARLLQPSVATQFIGFAPNRLKEVDFLVGDFDPSMPEGEEHKEWFSEGFEMQHLGGEEIRNSFIAAVEWAPNDNFTLKADAFLSNFDKDAFARGFRVKFDNADIVNPIIENNVVIGGTFNRNNGSLGSNTRVEIVNDDNTDHDELRNFGLNANWILSDQISLNADISHSESKSDFRNALLWSLVAQDATAAVPMLDDNVSISYLLHPGNLPDVGFNQNFSDFSQVMVSKYGIYPYENTDKLDAIRFDLDYQLNNNDIFSSFEAGIRYSERTYTNDRSVYEYGDDSNFSNIETPIAVNSDWATVVGFDGEFAGFPNYLAIDINAALNAWFPDGVGQPVQTWGVDSNGVLTGDTAWSVQKSGEVYEDILSGYFMANIDSEISGVEVTGNIGLRIVKTDQSATLLKDVGGVVALGAQNIADSTGLISSRYASLIEGVTYTDYLPSLNLNFRVDENSIIRVAAAKVMSRPPINRLAADANVSFEDRPLNLDGSIDPAARVMTVSSENSPSLRPFYAYQYDISYEHYFEDSTGAFIAALFYKDIQSFVQNFEIKNADFEALGYPVPEYAPGFEPNNAEGLPPRPIIAGGSFHTAVNNDEGGYIRGLELAYTQTFENLPDLFAGLGISASYSYTESDVTFETEFSGPKFQGEFPGLSPQVVSATIFWGYEGFDTHLNARYREGFVSDQVAIDTQTVNFEDELVVDYQASYNVNDELSLLFQANNLTDEPTKTYFGQESVTGTIQFFGRQFFVGANYKF